jgi:hypothetical protein
VLGRLPLRLEYFLAPIVCTVIGVAGAARLSFASLVVGGSGSVMGTLARLLVGGTLLALAIGWAWAEAAPGPSS